MQVGLLIQICHKNIFITLETNHVNHLLEEYEITPKDNHQKDTLISKQCPNCAEPNKPDSKFCVKCRMVLSYDAYSETLESEKQMEDKLTVIEERFNYMQGILEKLVAGLAKSTESATTKQLGTIIVLFRRKKRRGQKHCTII